MVVMQANAAALARIGEKQWGRHRGDPSLQPLSAQ